MRWNIKRDIFVLSVIFAAIVISLYYYRILPNTVATHYNANGIPNGYSSKKFLLAINLGQPILFYLLLTFIPFIDPFWKRIEKKYDIFLLFRDILITFLTFMATLTFISAKDNILRTDLLGIGFGLLFVLLGNYMPRLPRNFFFGIRSPWTLASEVVWARTHRISGILLTIAGIIFIALSLIKIKLFTLIIFILLPLALFSAFIYPFYLFKKLQREGSLKEEEL